MFDELDLLDRVILAAALTRVAAVRGLNRDQPVRAFVPKVWNYYALG
jgi:hypothetical protein